MFFAEPVRSQAPILPELTSKEEMVAYVRQEAVKASVSPDLAEYIVTHESQWNCEARGDLEPMADGVPAYARGCWQITQKYHPNVPDSCTDDIRCSTQYSLPLLKDRSVCIREFSTCRSYYAS